ncbi:MAG TPA: outer membrane beta-barrel protein [Steroidobacteraceae bacterium]|jgi:OOP family OmpA-OmpF porin
MKTTSVVLLSVVAIAIAGLADAAPRKRTRNADRIGPYGMGAVGQSSWTSDQSSAEQFLVDSFESVGATIRDLSVSTEDNDLGYNATFGYRFTRNLAVELGLAQFGSVESTGNADLDFGEGFVPVTLKFAFSAGGPMISALGILPLNDKFEFFGRLGYLFTSSEREFSSRVDGQSSGIGSARGDSQDVVLGAGAAYHFNQAYSARLEFQKLEELGDPDRSGQEDLDVISLGIVVRF